MAKAQDPVYLWLINNGNDGSDKQYKVEVSDGGLPDTSDETKDADFTHGFDVCSEAKEAVERMLGVEFPENEDEEVRLKIEVSEHVRFTRKEWHEEKVAVKKPRPARKPS